MITPESVTELLAKRLPAQESPSRSSEWVVFGRERLAACCTTARVLDDEPDDAVRLVMTVSLPVRRGFLIQEIVVGYGSSVDDAVVGAVDEWILHTVPLLRAALAPAPDADRGSGFEVVLSGSDTGHLHRTASDGPIERFELVHRQESAALRSWHVLARPFQLGGDADALEPLRDHLGHLPPMAMLLRPWCDSRIDGPWHSLQLHVIRHPEGEVRTRCWLDDREWEAGRTALHDAMTGGYPWPDGARPLWFTQLLVLRSASAR